MGVMEIVATGGGATGSIATTTEVGDLGVHFPQNQKILLLLALQFSQHINPTHDIVHWTMSKLASICILLFLHQNQKSPSEMVDQ